MHCRGWGVQWTENGGRCGICGDPWNEFPRDHEAPFGEEISRSCCYSIPYLAEGKYATGRIVRRYSSGSWIPVIVDITTNHGGYFSFKLCPNNDITRDPPQPCFDQHILQVSLTILIYGLLWSGLCLLLANKYDKDNNYESWLSWYMINNKEEGHDYK